MSLNQVYFFIFYSPVFNDRKQSRKHCTWFWAFILPS